MPSRLEVLKVRTLSVIMGSPADCYDPEFVRCIALAMQEPGGKAEVISLYRRLQDKFKRDFQTSRLKALVDDERSQLKIAAAPEPPKGWERQLIRRAGKDDGEPGPISPCESNAVLYFSNHPDFYGKLGWDEFSSEHAVQGDLPDPIRTKKGEPLKDHHDTLFQIWLQRHTQEAKWPIDAVRRAVDCAAKDNPFHPVKNYLNGLEPWDQVPRLSSWLFKYCGAGPAEGDDSEESRILSEFISAIGERWWISMMARIFQPGCEVHHVLVLEGAKGLGKSTLVRIIFGSWCSTITGDVSTKDNQALLSAGVWGLELDELDVLGKSAMRSVKSWVTRPFEKFRPTWGHRHENRPRQVVFLATVNGDDWALEEDRRWWPVACKRQFDLEALRADRDQLMAEALFKYRAGVPWHFDQVKDEALIATAKKEQAARVSEDVNADKYLYAANASAEKQLGFLYGSASVSDVLDELNIPLDRRRALGPECGRCLRAAGWTLWKPRHDGKQLRRYKRP